MTDSQQGTKTDQNFYEFMLAENQLVSTHSLHLSELHRQVEQFYLAAVSAIIGGGLFLLANQLNVSSVLIISISLLLIGAFGTQRSLRDLTYWESEQYLRASSVGLNRYFRQFDPASFHEFGRQLILEYMETPYYWIEFSRAPWKKFKLVGAFTTIHSVVVGGGAFFLALAVLPIVSTMLLPLLLPKLSISLVVSVVTSVIHFYWIAGRTEKAHVRVKTFNDRILRTEKQRI